MNDMTLEELPLAERLRVEVLTHEFALITGGMKRKQALVLAWHAAALRFVELERKHRVQIRPCTRSTLERLFYRWRLSGCKWQALVDRRKVAYARKGTNDPERTLKRSK